jgi:hypothetical protein
LPKTIAALFKTFWNGTVREFWKTNNGQGYPRPLLPSSKLCDARDAQEPHELEAAVRLGTAALLTVEIIRPAPLKDVIDLLPVRLLFVSPKRHLVLVSGVGA